MKIDEELKLLCSRLRIMINMTLELMDDSEPQPGTAEYYLLNGLLTTINEYEMEAGGRRS